VPLRFSSVQTGRAAFCVLAIHAGHPHIFGFELSYIRCQILLRLSRSASLWPAALVPVEDAVAIDPAPGVQWAAPRVGPRHDLPARRVPQLPALRQLVAAVARAPRLLVRPAVWQAHVLPAPVAADAHGV
jgi:hypothetical protein